eukprot:scaffold11341_cov28-Tisochrysis_lutea.AAC.5
MASCVHAYRRSAGRLAMNSWAADRARTVSCPPSSWPSSTIKRNQRTRIKGDVAIGAPRLLPGEPGLPPAQLLRYPLRSASRIHRSNVHRYPDFRDRNSGDGKLGQSLPCLLARRSRQHPEQSMRPLWPRQPHGEEDVHYLQRALSSIVEACLAFPPSPAPLRQGN